MQCLHTSALHGCTTAPYLQYFLTLLLYARHAEACRWAGVQACTVQNLCASSLRLRQCTCNPLALRGGLSTSDAPTVSEQPLRRCQFTCSSAHIGGKFEITPR